jgi:hypothetical protein
MARRRGAWLALAAAAVAAGATLWIGAAQGTTGASLPLGERLTRLQQAARQAREGARRRRQRIHLRGRFRGGLYGAPGQG